MKLCVTEKRKKAPGQEHLRAAKGNCHEGVNPQPGDGLPVLQVDEVE